MVIDVIGSLFDQILSDPKVPPQMARQIARLQLPVLRAALGDPSFFSSRKHPVRRFVNRIASLGSALRRLRRRAGQALPRAGARAGAGDRRRRLRPDRDLRAQAVGARGLHRRAGAQRACRTQRRPLPPAGRARKPTCACSSATRSSCRRCSSRLPVPDYLRDFLSQVWSQALMRAARLDGARQRDACSGCATPAASWCMSVQPKGSPRAAQDLPDAAAAR